MSNIVFLDGNTPSDGDAVIVQTLAVPGGTLYITASRTPGVGVTGVDTQFVPTSFASNTRYLSLTSGKADTGVGLTATATGGAMGIARTAGTSLALLGEATSGNAKTDKVFFELNLPDSYVAGQDIPVKVNAAILGTGTLTAASCTLSVAAYTEIAGAETALTVTAGQTIVAAATTYTFTVTGASSGLTPGSHVGLEVTGLVTTSSGANTLEVNSVALQA